MQEWRGRADDSLHFATRSCNQQACQGMVHVCACFDCILHIALEFHGTTHDKKTLTASRQMDACSVLKIKTLRAGSWLHVSVSWLHWFRFANCVVRLSAVNSHIVYEESTTLTFPYLSMRNLTFVRDSGVPRRDASEQSFLKAVHFGQDTSGHFYKQWTP